MAKKPIAHSKIDFDKAERYAPLPESGLSKEQVRERRHNGFTNFDSNVKTKSASKIILSNTLTVFNLVNLIIAVALIYVGSFKNITFMGVILANLFIGVFQELRAKSATEKLSFVSRSSVNVIRDGVKTEIQSDELVLDDVLLLKSGDLLVADCYILKGECEVNESFVTGESDSVYKKAGELLLSGSFLSSGECIARAEKIANQTYISQISKSAKTIKAPTSVLMKSLTRIISIIAAIIFPIGILLFLDQYAQSGHNLQPAIERTSAALLGMIPQGLMLLTSSALALSVVRLSKQKVLVKDLYCIEMLARVDTVCLDKTGTLTEGSLYVDKLIRYDKNADIEGILSLFSANLGHDNATMDAVSTAYSPNTARVPTKRITFSSKTKWSGLVFGDGQSYILGATEYILPGNDYITAQSRYYSKTHRVLLLAKGDGNADFGKLPGNITPIAFVLLCDKIRDAAPKLISYFNNQNVDVKIISGDNPVTVAAIAKQCGVIGSEKYIDCSTLRTDVEIRHAATKYTVFGRVSPFQKKQLVIELKRRRHTVAMTGDGVNDVLAMKEADCSVAMGAGTDAARNVSKMVLLDSNFDCLPHVINEGRRCVNNIQRSASFFLSKTIYSCLLVFILLFLHKMYPFEPIQQSFISLFGIGIPSFILALEPNFKRIEGSFFRNVLQKSLPGGLTVTLFVTLLTVFAPMLGMSPAETSSIAVMLTGFISLLLLTWVCVPFQMSSFALFSFVSLMYISGPVFLRGLLSLAVLPADIYLMMLGQMAMCVLFMLMIIYIVDRFLGKDKK